VTSPPQHRLPIQPWMNTPSVRRVMQALGAGAVDVRFVGGAVRNAVMDQPIGDIDIATPDAPGRVMERLLQAGLKAVPTGLAHGTVMAVVDSDTFEITTLRRDTACDGRHAAVEFTGDWHEDAGRRDFTFNAMSLRLDGALFDDHGGFDDARAGRVRFVGDASDRIQEDYLRILRLFRFFAWYGRVAIDDATIAACTRHAAGLARLSAERIRQELVKLLAAPSPLEAIQAMMQSGVLAQVLPEADGGATLRNLLALAPGADWLLRLAALLGGDDGDGVAARLKFSNADRDRLAALRQPTPHIDDHSDPATLRHALYHSGAAPVRDRVLLAWARRRGEAGEAPWRALLEAVDDWTPKTFPVSGADVLALGVAPGPEVGRILAAAEAWWIGAGFEPGRRDVLAHIQEGLPAGLNEAPDR